MSAGQDFVKMLRPAGAALFMLLFIVFLVFAFSSGRAPIPGYEPPENIGSIEELQAELETNVFPHLDGITGSRVTEGRLEITIEKDSFIASRAAIIRYFDKELFTFISKE